MIRAMILDIDGVILGHQDRVNFPLPTLKVQGRLQNLSKRLPISLCTVKAHFAVEPIIAACGIQKSFHITDAGATLVQESSSKTTTLSIAPTHANRLINELRQCDIYVEWYSTDNYFALPNENTMIRDGRTKLFGRPATVLSQPDESEICKIIAFPLNEWQTTTLIDIAEKYTTFTSLHWGINPTLLPRTNAFFTNPLATKRTGAEKIAALEKIPLTDILAIGDSANDWTFMELCGYVGTLENGSSELKELIKGKGKNGFTSDKTVNENGVLDILDHFGL